MKSSWSGVKAQEFYSKKWYQTPIELKRLLPDEKYEYDLGSKINNYKWMPFKHSLLSRSSLPSHQQLKFVNSKPVDFSNLGCSEMF
jgi:hypothetical protein